jgi:prepilin-type N-terminal cleavage/methylation domain-containing protein
VLRVRRSQAGYSLPEVLVATAVTSLLLAAVATAVVGLLGAYRKVQDTQLADDRGRVVLDRLDRDLRQAGTLNPPGVAGGAAYVEYQTDVGAAGAPASCTQWRLDGSAHTLAVRRWTLPAPAAAPAWSTVATGVVNDLAAEPPFQVTPAQGAVEHAQLTVQLRLALDRGQALTRATVTARNSAPDSGTAAPVCMTYGRS